MDDVETDDVSVVREFIARINAADVEGLGRRLRPTTRRGLRRSAIRRARREHRGVARLRRVVAELRHLRGRDRRDEASGSPCSVTRPALHLELPDEEEEKITLIWVADVVDGLVHTWRLEPDTIERRAWYGSAEHAAHRGHEGTLLGLRGPAQACEVTAGHEPHVREEPGGILMEVQEGLAPLVEGAAERRSAVGAPQLRAAPARGCRVRRRADVARQKFIIPVRSPPLDIRTQMQADLKEAMKARDRRGSWCCERRSARAETPRRSSRRRVHLADGGSGDNRGRSAGAVRCRGAIDHRGRARRAARCGGRTRGARAARRRGASRVVRPHSSPCTSVGNLQPRGRVAPGWRRVRFRPRCRASARAQVATAISASWPARRAMSRPTCSLPECTSSPTSAPSRPTRS